MTEDNVYIICEIGQNHNGDAGLAEVLIDMAAMPVYHMGQRLAGVDAVKFTKRDLSQETTKSEYDRPYDSPHAYGETYGKHREALELTAKQHGGLCGYAHIVGLDFIDTICAPDALQILDYCHPDYLKIASRDIDNLPLIEKVAVQDIPIILSTGMSDFTEISKAVDVIKQYHNRITILHCVSEYPAQYRNLNLNTIPYLVRQFPDLTIGYSDHTTGVLAPALAVALGAKVIEKHITLDRQMKGTDHAGSMNQEGIRRVVRDIRNTEIALGYYSVQKEEAIRPFAQKLRRSIAAKRDIPQGDLITEDDICLLSPGTGIPWGERDKIVGHIARWYLSEQELIFGESVAKKFSTNNAISI